MFHGLSDRFQPKKSQPHSGLALFYALAKLIPFGISSHRLFASFQLYNLNKISKWENLCPPNRLDQGEASPPAGLGIGDPQSRVLISCQTVVENTMSQKPTKQLEDEPQKNKATIIVAWIGFGSTILVAVIAAFAQIYPTIANQTPIPQTTSPAIPTSLPSVTLPFTDTFITSTALPTFFQAIPVPIGEDWTRGCISTLWQIYPSSIVPVEKGNGCWQEPLHAYSAENGDLDFFYERKGGSPEVYGLFTPLPENGSVTFTVRLRDLYNADLWMGVYGSPDLNSQGLLMAILNGPVEKRSIIQKDPHTYETLQGSVALAQNNGYSITFTFDSLDVSSRVNPAIFVVNPVSIPSSKKWLFLGYKGLNGSYRIDGTFLNFELKQ